MLYFQEIERPPLLVDMLVDEFLESIIEGQLTPRTRISEVKLSEQFNVSRTPLREALFKLESLGFVTKGKNSRWEVVSLQVEDIVGKYEMIIILENNAILRSTEESRILACQKLDSYIEKMKEYVEKKDYPSYRDMDMKFHRCLFDLHKNDCAKTIYNEMVMHVRWIRSLAISPLVDLGLSIEDHAVIVTNLKEQKISETIAVLDKHHNRVVERIKEIAYQNNSFLLHKNDLSA